MVGWGEGGLWLCVGLWLVVGVCVVVGWVVVSEEVKEGGREEGSESEEVKEGREGVK